MQINKPRNQKKAACNSTSAPRVLHVCGCLWVASLRTYFQKTFFLDAFCLCTYLHTHEHSACVWVSMVNLYVGVRSTCGVTDRGTALSFVMVNTDLCQRALPTLSILSLRSQEQRRSYRESRCMLFKQPRI